MPAQQLVHREAQLRYQQTRWAEQLAGRTEITRTELTNAADVCLDWFRTKLNIQFRQRVAWKQHASSPHRFPPVEGYEQEWRDLDAMQSRGVARVGELQVALASPKARHRVEQAIRIEIACGASVWTFLEDVVTDAGYEALASLANNTWGHDWEARLPRITDA